MQTTFPRLLRLHAAQRPTAPALREKALGIWQTWSWAQLAALVQDLAAGLAAAGLQRGEHVVVIGENRPRLYATLLATQSLGAIPVPLYQDAAAAEYVFPLCQAEVRFAVVEDQEQVDKLLAIRTQCPALTHLWFDDPRGLRHSQEPGLAPLDQLIEAGQREGQHHPTRVQDEEARGQPHDVAAMFYTSGTTGAPKGVVHTHASLLDRAAAGARFDRLGPQEEVLAYLPLAWIGQNIFSYAQWLACGYVVNCPESADTVMIDLKEIGPSYYFAPPRIFEALLTSVTLRMADASAFKRWGFQHGMALAQRVGPALMEGRPVSWAARMAYRLGEACLYAPLRNALGLSRVRVAYTAGEAIGPDLFRFYRALGVNLKQLYGSTETAVFVCLQPDHAVRADTVGVPIEGVELRVDDRGELQVRSPGLLQAYYKNPQATAEAKTDDGWYRTGDAGYVDEQGHLHIIDRAHDVGRLLDGSMFAPRYIENKLKFFPHIKEAVAFGDQQAQVCAFINIDFDAVGHWAERQHLPYTGYTDLAGRPEVLALVRACVQQVNADLAADARLAGSQIRRFLVLHKELDADDGELTRTRKVRRGAIAQKYQVLVDALYSGRTAQYIETPVCFEDGRTGVAAATLQLVDVPTP